MMMMMMMIPFFPPSFFHIQGQKTRRQGAQNTGCPEPVHVDDVEVDVVRSDVAL
jgi:hypothetical protein